MNIPEKIIRILDGVSIERRGVLYAAVVEYLRSGVQIEIADQDTKAFFMALKIILDQIIKRRAYQAAYRARRKQRRAVEGGNISTKSNESVKTEIKVEQTAIAPAPPMTRQQRRALERKRAKEARRA